METINFDGTSPAGGGASQGEENTGENNSAPKAPINDGRKKKLIWTGAILTALILSVIAWQYWQYTQTPYYKQMQAVKTLENMAKESDKWGGKTPEETVALFTDAVKKGDFELASKYGNIDNNIKSEIEKMKNEGKIDQLIKWLETGEIKKFSGVGKNNEIIDVNLIVKENGQEIWILSMHKSESGAWKIDEF